MNLLDLDARWRRFNDPDFRSPIDGRSFYGVYDLGFDAPDDWIHGARADEPLLSVGEDRLSPELCRMGPRRFLRVVLPFPIRGAGAEALFMAPWAEVRPEDFYTAVAAMEAGAPLPETTGTLANVLPGFEADEHVPLRLSAAPAGERPQAEPLVEGVLEDPGTGISFDRLLDIYAAAGDDIRPHLVARDS